MYRPKKIMEYFLMGYLSGRETQKNASIREHPHCVCKRRSGNKQIISQALALVTGRALTLVEMEVEQPKTEKDDESSYKEGKIRMQFTLDTSNSENLR
jgi:hypothetical protein